MLGTILMTFFFGCVKVAEPRNKFVQLIFGEYGTTYTYFSPKAANPFSLILAELNGACIKSDNYILCILARNLGHILDSS